MNVEQKAKELMESECAVDPKRNGVAAEMIYSAALRAIARALEQPEGREVVAWVQLIGPNDHVAVITDTKYGRGIWFNTEAACEEFCRWPFRGITTPPKPAEAQAGGAVDWPTEAKQESSGGDWVAYSGINTVRTRHRMDAAQAYAWNTCLSECKRATTAPPAKVPDGYVLVPVEPTPEMLESAGTVRGYGDCHGEATSADSDHLEWWAAMLAAAQQPKEGA